MTSDKNPDLIAAIQAGHVDLSLKKLGDEILGTDQYGPKVMGTCN